MALRCLFDSLRGTECAREALFSRVSEPRSNDPCVDPCVVLRLTLPSFPVLSNQSLVCLLVSLSFFCLFVLIWISGDGFCPWFFIFLLLLPDSLWGPCSFPVCLHWLSSVGRLCIFERSSKRDLLIAVRYEQQQGQLCIFQTVLSIMLLQGHHSQTRVFFFLFCNIGSIVRWPRRLCP